MVPDQGMTGVRHIKFILLILSLAAGGGALSRIALSDLTGESTMIAYGLLIGVIVLLGVVFVPVN